MAAFFTNWLAEARPAVQSWRVTGEDLAVAQGQSIPGRPIGWIKPKRAFDWLAQREGCNSNAGGGPQPRSCPFLSTLLSRCPSLWASGEWCGGHPGALGQMRGYQERRKWKADGAARQLS